VRARRLHAATVRAQNGTRHSYYTRERCSWGSVVALGLDGGASALTTKIFACLIVYPVWVLLPAYLLRRKSRSVRAQVGSRGGRLRAWRFLASGLAGRSGLQKS
jgi:hypothetical protein